MTMPYTISNLSSSPIIVALNSGRNLRLSPGTSSEDIRDAELKDNAKVNKLKQQRLIAIEQRGDAPSPEAAATTDDGGEKKKAKSSKD
jgi:hypothetical protein